MFRVNVHDGEPNNCEFLYCASDKLIGLLVSVRIAAIHMLPIYKFPEFPFMYI
jgi:hypothetical protein